MNKIYYINESMEVSSIVIPKERHDQTFQVPSFLCENESTLCELAILLNHIVIDSEMSKKLEGKPKMGSGILPMRNLLEGWKIYYQYDGAKAILCAAGWGVKINVY